MLKKVLSIMIAGAISLSLVSCTNETVKNGTEQPTEISMLFMEPGSAPYKADWVIIKEVEKKMNVKLKLQVVPGRDYNQKRSIVFASGEIPDIVVNTWPTDMSQYAANGIILPVSDYLNKLPNLKKIISDWDLKDTIENISELDGKFYVLPDLRKSLVGSQCFGIREDIFKANNLPIPETYEDLYNVLLKLKQIYPSSLGLGDSFNSKFLLSFAAESFNTNGGYSIPFGYSYHFDKNEWYYAPTSNEYKVFLSFFNKMFKNGCLDPEAFTQDEKQFQQKLLNNQYFVMPIYGPYDAKRKTAELQKLGNKEAKITAIYPLAGPSGLRKVKPSSRNQGGVALRATIAKRPDFDKVMAFCDWLYYSEEAGILTTIGAEGVSYDKKDGNYIMRPEVKTGANPGGSIDMLKEYGIGTMGLTTLVPDIIPENIRQTITDPEQYEFEKYIKEHDMTTPDDPIVKMTPEQRERSKLLIAKLNDYTSQMIMKFIFNSESFENWDSYVQECNQKGAQELIEIVRTAWKENNKK